jgi:hypothetical protein
MFNSSKSYTRPQVLSHQPIRFETAHSWNKGVGNKNPSSNGNGGVHYPNDPRPQKPGTGPGSGKGNNK